MDEFANDYYEDMMDWLYEFRRNKLRPHKKTDLTNETEIAALSHNNVQYKKFKDFKDLTGDPAYKHKLILLLGYGNNSSCGQICKTVSFYETKIRRWKFSMDWAILRSQIQRIVKA